MQQLFTEDYQNNIAEKFLFHYFRDKKMDAILFFVKLSDLGLILIMNFSENACHLLKGGM